MSDVPEKRSGQFMPGQSGNPAGRPAGSKNKVNQLKLELEQSLREDPLVKSKVSTIFHRMLDMAACGDPKMIKLVMDKFVSPAALDEAKNEGPQEYVFKIVRADPKDVTNAIEGEYKELENNASGSEQAEPGSDAGSS